MDTRNTTTSTPDHNSEALLLLSLANDIISCRSQQEIQDIVSNRLQRFFLFNEVMICLDEPDGLTHASYIHTLTESTMQHPGFARGAALRHHNADGVYDAIKSSPAPLLLDMKELYMRKERPYYIDFFYSHRAKELLGVSMRMNDQTFGAAFIYTRKKEQFGPGQLALVQTLCSLLAFVISNIRAYEKINQQLEEINHYKSILEEENQYLHAQIKTTGGYHEIAGSSTALHQVFEMISRVAGSDTTVLITGETGTGKELVAGAIHKASPRKDKLMVKVNCAVLPANLIESELFGHEKGSFTGATERHIGKFELANNGTLFLDEIGEMTPDLQVKLLRAIQEKEIERIGGKTTIKTDVRIITATNRNLQQEVNAGRFRADLFYRLNVFPINLPPLRERRDDIPILARHFMELYTRKTGKGVTDISQKAIKEMTAYDWPGNVRELEHLMERTVLLTAGKVITEVNLPGSRAKQPVNGDNTIKTIHETEREHILTILKHTNGRIKGPGGAAELLKLPPTTLYSKIKKLGIRKVTG